MNPEILRVEFRRTRANAAGLRQNQRAISTLVVAPRQFLLKGALTGLNRVHKPLVEFVLHWYPSHVAGDF